MLIISYFTTKLYLFGLIICGKIQHIIKHVIRNLLNYSDINEFGYMPDEKYFSTHKVTK